GDRRIGGDRLGVGRHDLSGANGVDGAPGRPGGTIAMAETRTPRPLTGPTEGATHLSEASVPDPARLARRRIFIPPCPAHAAPPRPLVRGGAPAAAAAPTGRPPGRESVIVAQVRTPGEALTVAATVGARGTAAVSATRSASPAVPAVAISRAAPPPALEAAIVPMGFVARAALLSRGPEPLALPLPEIPPVSSHSALPVIGSCSLAGHGAGRKFRAMQGGLSPPATSR